MENFKPVGIPGYEKDYLCSPEGVVYSMTFKRPLKCRNLHGTYKVIMRKGGERHAISLGRVVASTFIPNPENKPQVHHINHDGGDNRVENLMWVTAKEHGKFTTSNRKVFNTRKISANLDGQVVHIFMSIREAAKAMNTGPKRISRVLQGKRPKHRGFNWEYLD